MKRFISLVITVSMVLSMCLSISAAQVSFTDLASGHWAYDAVMQLVNDGTVNGMGDGTYAPNKLVTRAEFAKMIGKTDVRFEADFDDLSSEHWSYDYVMWSGIKGDDNNQFRPDEPMLRDDVIDALWSRNNMPEDVYAPSIITNQSSNPVAASWAYSSGLMIGNDGIDLRLDEGISRAEVASLIVRSRSLADNNKNFVDLADEKVLEAVFEGINAFDKEYDSDGTITNGEMARAALRIAFEEYSLRYSQLGAQEPFKHEYVKDLYAIGEGCIGKEKVTADFIDKPVNNLDMVSMLAYAFIKKSNSGVVYDTSSVCYSDVGSIEKNTAYTCLAYANSKGIGLYADKVIKPDSVATMKSVAAVILQFNEVIGAMTYYETAGESYREVDISISRNVNAYPKNANEFVCVLSSLPAEVYTTAFLGMDASSNNSTRTPVEMFEFARDFRSLFLQLIARDKSKIFSNSGVDAKFSYYPQLVCDSGRGFTARLKVEIVDVGGKALTYGDVFDLAEGVDGSAKLEQGMTFFVDAHMPYELGAYPDTKITFGKMI